MNPAVRQLREATDRLRRVSTSLRVVTAKVHADALDALTYPAAILCDDGTFCAANARFRDAYPHAIPGAAWTDTVPEPGRAALRRALLRAREHHTVVTVLVDGVARLWSLSPVGDGRIAVSA